MRTISEKVAYLKGLAEGAGMTEDKTESKMILKMLDILADVAEEVEELQEAHDDLADQVDEIDEDLATLEDDFYEDEEDDDEDDLCPGCGHIHDDEEFEGIMQYDCPHCGHTVELDLDHFDFDEEYVCPACNKPFFEDEEDEGEDEDK